jgi:heat shock protein HslJ
MALAAAFFLVSLLNGTQWVAPPPADQTLSFKDGKIATFTGCNRGFGSYIEGDDGASLTISLLGSTKMACEEAAMKAEADWIALMAKVKTYALEDNELLLLDEAGETLAKLALKAEISE